MAQTFHESLTKEQITEYKKKTQVLTPTFRVSWPKLFKAESFGDSAPKFSVEMLFPKDKPIKCIATQSEKNDEIEIQTAMKYAIALKLGTNNKKWPQNLTLLKDCDADEKRSGRPECINHFAVAASSREDQPPRVIDAYGKPIVDPAQFRAGCFARAEISIYYYFHPKFKSHHVLAQILVIQKIREGQPLDGRRDTDLSKFAIAPGELDSLTGSQPPGDFDGLDNTHENDGYGFLG